MQMELIKCTPQYWEFVRTLRNDERVLDGFIKSVHITEKMQNQYMKTHSQFYRIALVDGEPTGYVGVIEDDIRVCTHPDYQGKGIGKFMINQIMQEEPTAFAKVKIDNEASMKLFEACGFTKKFYILTKN
jgi:ribosomal protein S18 acetylase RimI-like enzyme